MSVKICCDFCGTPLDFADGGYVVYRTKIPNICKMFPSLCKNCANKLDTVIERVEVLTRERCQNFGHWDKINKARREQLGTKG